MQAIYIDRLAPCTNSWHHIQSSNRVFQESIGIKVKQKLEVGEHKELGL